MNKAIQLISTFENIGRLVEFIPGVKIFSSAEEDYSYIKINYKDSRDIVIIDLKRALGNGMNFLQNVKITYFTSIVIVITNLNNDDFRNRCFNHGADYFFDKETEIKEFNDVLNKQLKVLTAEKTLVPEAV
jgi:DNA-binding NarL/FixJ family response regulator